jgi:hypothetical protein
MAPELSDCCGALVTVKGDTTQHWECRACKKPCDLTPQPALQLASVFLVGVQDEWHAIDAPATALRCELHAWAVCGAVVRQAEPDQPYDFTAYPVSLGACPECLWTVAARTDALDAALATLGHPLAHDIAAAVLNEAGRRELDLYDAPEMIDLLTAVSRHAPARLVSEECRDGDCEHEGDCPGRSACAACSLQAGSWAGEWEGQYRDECAITSPCAPLLALAAHFGVVAPAAPASEVQVDPADLRAMLAHAYGSMTGDDRPVFNRLAQAAGLVR